MSADRWQRMYELYHRAAELPAAERGRFLGSACGSDAELRRAVEALLEVDSDALSFLEQPLVERRDEAAPPTLDRHAAPSEGPVDAELSDAERRIGPYRVRRKIGAGGMGVVYLAARHDGAFRRRVAIKLLRRELEGEETRRRLEIERHVLAGLESPYVARLYDGGTTEEGRPYLVMEYVDGLPIDRYCDRHRLPVGRRIELFLKVCEAVDDAHRSLIVHRDLKPSNILVGADGVPKLLDFGIAKILDPGLVPSDHRQTATWLRPLTPQFASPEQLRGGKITTASDVYSLGVVLYLLLSGRVPYRFRGRSLGEIERLIERPPTRPSVPSEEAATIADARRTTPERLARRLRGDLDHIVLKALRVEPHERYRSVRELADDLRRAAAGLPVLARQGSTAYRVSRFLRRHRAAVAVAALFVVLLVGFAADRAAQASRLARALEVAERARDRAEQERDEKQRVIRLVSELFRAADPTQARGEYLTVHEVLAKSDDSLERAAGRLPMGVQATLRETIGSIYYHLGALGVAEPHFVAALDVRRRLHGEESLEVARTLGALATVLGENGDDDERAERMLRDAIARVRQLGGDRHPDLLVLLNELVTLLCYQGAYAAAAEPSAEALELARELASGPTAELADALNNRAAVLKNRGTESGSADDLASARRLFERALAIYRQLLGDVHPDVADALNNVADLARQLGRPEEALELHREVLGLRQKLYPDGHWSIAQSHNHLGKINRQLGRYRDAEPHFRAALELLTEQLGPERYAVTRPALGLAAVLIPQQRFNEAEGLLQKSYQIRLGSEQRGAPRSGTLEVVALLADLYQAWGQPARAAEYRRLLAEPVSRAEDRAEIR